MKQLSIENIYHEIMLLSDDDRVRLYARMQKEIYQSVKKMTEEELITRTLQAETDIQKKRLLSQSDLEKESQLW